MDQGLIEHAAAQDAPRMITLREVLEISHLSKTTVYEGIKKKTFPAPVKLGGKYSHWVYSEVLAWLKERIERPR